MTYHKNNFTYGAEHEWSDWNVFTDLHGHGKWDKKDNTMVNSNGIANDPQGKSTPFGGEINSRPTSTIQEQVDIVNHLIDLMDPKPAINYRSNLHIHIGVPGLKDDLDGLKKLLAYVHRWLPDALKIIEPIPEPQPHEYNSTEAHNGARARYKRRRKSHQLFKSKRFYEQMMAAETAADFHTAEVPVSRGKPAWHLAARPCVNIRQLFEESGTIEFRHFPGTLDSYKVGCALVWCREFVHNALNNPDKPALSILDEYDLTFPTFEKYNHDLELLYELTNFSHQSRKKVNENMVRAIEIITNRKENV